MINFHNDGSIKELSIYASKEGIREYVEENTDFWLEYGISVRNLPHRYKISCSNVVQRLEFVTTILNDIVYNLLKSEHQFDILMTLRPTTVKNVIDLIEDIKLLTIADEKYINIKLASQKGSSTFINEDPATIISIVEAILQENKAHVEDGTYIEDEQDEQMHSKRYRLAKAMKIDKKEKSDKE